MNNRRINPILLAIVAVVVLIPVGGIAYWLISPLFEDDEVNEALPEDIVFLQPNALPDGMTETQAVATMEAAAVAPDVTAGEPMPVDVTVVTTTDQLATEPVTEQPVATEEVTAAPIFQGQFRNGDSFHQGSGVATLYRLSDGRHFLRFENFSVTNGPDLHVYLVPRANRDTVSVAGYVDLGMLKGNLGDQNYFIEADIAIGPEVSIVIWCEPFAVLFSTATLDPVAQ